MNIPIINSSSIKNVESSSAERIFNHGKTKKKQLQLGEGYQIILNNDEAQILLKEIERSKLIKTRTTNNEKYLRVIENLKNALEILRDDVSEEKNEMMRLLKKFMIISEAETYCGFDSGIPCKIIANNEEKKGLMIGLADHQGVIDIDDEYHTVIIHKNIQLKHGQKGGMNSINRKSSLSTESMGSSNKNSDYSSTYMSSSGSKSSSQYETENSIKSDSLSSNSGTSTNIIGGGKNQKYLSDNAQKNIKFMRAGRGDNIGIDKVNTGPKYYSESSSIPDDGLCE